MSSLALASAAIGDVIVRRAKIDHARTPRGAIAATNRVQYVDSAVVEAMPRGKADEVEVIFFKVGRWISDADLEKEYELRGLVPVDPFSLAAVNEADPAFADEQPNSTHWRDADGRWCFAAFGLWNDDERYVGVFRGDDDWLDDWWFAGLHK